MGSHEISGPIMFLCVVGGLLGSVALMVLIVFCFGCGVDCFHCGLNCRNMIRLKRRRRQIKENTSGELGV